MENVATVLFNAISSGRCSTYDIELVFVSVDGACTDLLNKACPNGMTLLCLACKLNRADLVPLLLHKGAQPNVPSIYLKKYPLHYASDHSDGNRDIVMALLEHGAEVNVQDEDGNTALHMACSESNVAVAKDLLEAGANVALTDLDDETPLVRACLANSVELVDILLKAGSDPNFPEGRPLEVAVRVPSLESLKLLIDAGAEVSRNTYLSFASELNYLDMMKVLHNYGAGVNITGHLGLTALHYACRSQEASHDAVRLLLLWGSNPNLASSAGDTALHFACQISALDKVRVLLTYGADVNRVDGTHTSPLVAALTSSCAPHHLPYLTMVKLLLAAGARLSPPALERIKVLILYLQRADDEKEELLRVLAQHVSGPASLQRQCRAVIRHELTGNIDRRAQLLPLPKAVVGFVQFSDIPGCAYTA